MAQVQTTPVRVDQVVEQSVASTVELVGTVMPLRRSVVASGAEGLVVSFLAKEGDVVKQGQELARLRTRTLEIQRSAAEAALKVSQHELAELKSRWPDEIERARAALAVAEAKTKLAQSKQQRLERLVARSAASGEDRDEASGMVTQAMEEVARLKAEYALVDMDGPRAEKTAQAEARVDAAESEVSRVMDEIEKRIVRAPFTGFVVAEHTEIGQWLSASSPVVELVELSAVDVQVMVPERHIHELHKGKAVRVRIEALGERTFEGKVSRVVPQADTRARQFPVKIRIPNENDETQQPLIQAGMFAIARLPLGASHLAKLVPKDALVLQAGKSVVFVAEPDGEGHKVSAVFVKPGAAHEGLVEIEGKLEPGQLVVVRGNERLTAGQAVQIETKTDKDATADDAARDKPPTNPAR